MFICSNSGLLSSCGAGRRAPAAGGAPGCAGPSRARSLSRSLSRCTCRCARAYRWRRTSSICPSVGSFRSVSSSSWQHHRFKLQAYLKGHQVAEAEDRDRRPRQVSVSLHVLSREETGDRDKLQSTLRQRLPRCLCLARELSLICCPLSGISRSLRSRLLVSFKEERSLPTQAFFLCPTTPSPISRKHAFYEID